eukprot:c19324_g1_i1.p1 GENE.c19324_g1_i1~~c19324_g1_i1.p1  ORF type:complete len:247 (+),score=98.84 c19324_g1_i1:34-741(+)
MSEQPIKMLELEVFNELNLVRRFPHEYAKLLDEMIPYFKENEFDMPRYERTLTVEGQSAVKEAAAALRACPESLPPFTDISKGLSLAAQEHVKDTGKKGTRSHIGTNGSIPTDRIRQWGGWHKNAGENLSFGSKDAREIVLSFLIDDGIEDRGHRKNILNPDFRVIGVHHGPHSKTNVMTCVVFATGFGEGAIESLKTDYQIVQQAKEKDIDPILQQLMDHAVTSLDSEIKNKKK